jgi:flagellar hook-associated protein 2
MVLSSAGSATISSAGIGSGLDVNSIVTQLMAVEKAPLTKLQTTATTMQTQLSAFGQMQSLVSALHDAAAPLFNADSFALTTATSSDSASVSAGSTVDAVPGTYTVAVSALASGQATVSASGQFADANATVGTGAITISLGSWNAGQTAFTPKTGAQDITIPIGASENTLAGIRDKINAANAGVSASLITDVSGTRLALQSSSTGAQNGFRVTVADADANNTDNLGLSRLAFDPPGGATQTTLTQSAANTQATINGIAVSTTGTALGDVVQGISFNLSKVTTTPVTIGIARNTDSVKTMLTSFAASYNALNQFIGQATHYDSATQTAALLQGDSTAEGIGNQLRAAVGQAGTASSAFSTLSSIGLEFQKDGSLKLNDAKVNAALKNLPELKKALANVDAASPAKNGFAKKIAAWADSLLATGGTLPGRTQSIQARIDSNKKDQASLQDRLTLTEQRLRAQYAALDVTMSKANSLQKYVTQQITTWNNSNNKN